MEKEKQFVEMRNEIVTLAGSVEDLPKIRTEVFSAKIHFLDDIAELKDEVAETKKTCKDEMDILKKTFKVR